MTYINADDLIDADVRADFEAWLALLVRLLEAEVA